MRVMAGSCSLNLNVGLGSTPMDGPTLIKEIRKLKPDMDPRFFAEAGTATADDEGGIIIADDSDGEVDVEDI